MNAIRFNYLILIWKFLSFRNTFLAFVESKVGQIKVLTVRVNQTTCNFSHSSLKFYKCSPYLNSETFRSKNNKTIMFYGHFSWNNFRFGSWKPRISLYTRRIFNKVFKESEKQILNNNLHILLVSQMKCCSCFHANKNNNF